MIFTTPDTKPRYTEYNMVMKNLYIGSAKSILELTDLGLVVNCTPDYPMSPYCEKFIRIPVWDSPSETSHMYTLIQQTSVLENIHKCLLENKKVLVHCAAGIQRSCAVVACYLCKYYGMKTDESIEYIRRYRQVAFSGGSNFYRTIKQFESIRV
jgi:protein-tyrosine phosphatase